MKLQQGSESCDGAEVEIELRQKSSDHFETAHQQRNPSHLPFDMSLSGANAKMSADTSSPGIDVCTLGMFLIGLWIIQFILSS